MGLFSRHRVLLRAGFLGDERVCDARGAPAMIAFPTEGFLAAPCQRTVRRGHWLERDLRRALDVASRSGMDGYRVEIAPDGTISIVVGYPESTPGKPVKRRP